jgi:ABC-2 type transport system permease protein
VQQPDAAPASHAPTGPRGKVLGGLSAAWVQAGWTARRLLRGRMLWVAAVFTLGPILFTVAMAESRRPVRWDELFAAMMLLTAIVPPLFAASTTADEIEDRTYTYLWSRPLPRWSVLAGKLIATVPMTAAVLCLTMLICFQLGRGSVSPTFPWPESALAHALGALALASLGLSMASCGISVLMPRHGLGVTYAYLLALDAPLAAMPFSIANLSITHHILTVAGVQQGGSTGSVGVSIIWLLGIGGFWFAIALRRISASEFSAGDS